MRSERLQLKMYVDGHVELEALIPVFHRFIRERVIQELLIDVVDYGHVAGGPGVVLIGHSADYYLGALDGAYGLVYSSKRDAPAEDARLAEALTKLVNVARLLERESGLNLRFQSSELSLRLTDRLRAPNDDATFAEVKSEVERVLAGVYGAEVAVERVNEPRGPLALRIHAGSSPTLQALLEKLGSHAAGAAR